jgi:hypothetical protein
MFAQALLYLCHPSAQRQGTLKRISQRFFNTLDPEFFNSVGAIALNRVKQI